MPDLGGWQSVAVWSVWLAATLLVYALIGYPLLMALIARTCERTGNATPSSDVELPTVSLIVPAYNEEVVLQRKIENALALDYPKEKLEIIVASDGSTDGTVAIAERFRGWGVMVLDFPERRGKAAVLNDAVSKAQGEVVCLCDANVLFESNALRWLVSRLQDSRIGAVTGDVRLTSEDANFAAGEKLYYLLERAIQTGESHVGSVMGVDGGMYVLRKELFQSLPLDTILDDFVTTMRVIRQGKRVVYEPKAVARENGTPLARQEFRRRMRVSAGAMQALKRGDFPPVTRIIEFWQFLSHKLLRWLGPVWLMLLLGCSVWLSNASRIFLAITAAQLVFYSVALAATFSLSLRRTRLGGVVFYFAMSHVAMAIGLVKGLLNRQPATWQRTERRGATSLNAKASLSA